MTLSQAFRHQSESCVKLGSPFMGQLCALLSERWHNPSRLRQYFDSFTGDIGPAGHSLPLRLAGGLHALVLTGRAPDLQAVYPPQTVPDDSLWQAVATALETHESFLLDWVASAPQTNEVRRSAALMPAAAMAATYFDAPAVLSELGASGGLNLNWDSFRLDLPGGHLGAAQTGVILTPEWTGDMPPTHLPQIAGRAGVDLNPLDPQKPDDLLRLKAYLWADQPHRMSLTQAAAALQHTKVAQEDAIDWLARRLNDIPPGHMHILQHTVAWQYFPKDAQARGAALIEAAGARATAAAPLAWIAMENDGDRSGAVGAHLTLRLWPGDVHLSLGRADFHGRWISWNPQNRA
ncbi:MAG: DUF2332 domain-containing protein [Roseobacter sp.]